MDSALSYVGYAIALCQFVLFPTTCFRFITVKVSRVEFTKASKLLTAQTSF